MLLLCSAQVHKGRCKLYDEVVAIKRLDLDSSWDLVRLHGPSWPVMGKQPLGTCFDKHFVHHHACQELLSK